MDVKVNRRYKQIDVENIKEFQKTGTNRPEEPRFRCVICGKKASIESSCSAVGHRLIHNSCMQKTFGADILEAFRWMEQEDK